jgi:hypothetical protein
MRVALAAVAVAATLAGCGGDKKAEPARDIGAQTADVSVDTKTLGEANAAAGDVVRAAGDCDAVKAALPEAQRKLDEIEPHVRTAAGRTTFLALRKRVNDVAQMCP